MFVRCRPKLWKILTEAFDLLEFLSLLFLRKLRTVFVLDASCRVHPNRLDRARHRWRNADVSPSRRDHKRLDALETCLICNAFAIGIDVMKATRLRSLTLPPLRTPAPHDRLAGSRCIELW